jgi:hypothetical protein
MKKKTASFLGTFGVPVDQIGSGDLVMATAPRAEPTMSAAKAAIVHDMTPTVLRKRRRATMKNTLPIRTMARNCGHTTSIPAPR